MKKVLGGIWGAAGIMIVVAVFLFASVASAQEEVAPEEAEATIETEEEITIEEETIIEVEESVEADEEVDAEDFGVTEAKIILPDNPLYGFKRLFRNIREAVTFDPVKKAELKLQHASQELVDANVVLEEHPDDPEAIEIVSESIEEYTEQISEIQEDIGEVVEDEEFEIEVTVEEEEESEEVEVDDALLGDVEDSTDFMAVMLDRNIQFNKLFEQMKERMLSQSEESGAPEAVLAMEDFASGAQTQVGAMIASFAKAGGARFAAGIMDGVMDAQEGSQFKDLRNNEMLQRLEDHVPEEARDAIRRAQENGMKRFAKNFEGIHPDKRAERFLGYMGTVDGDETRHMQMLDVMKNLDDMPPEIRAQVEAAKDVMVNRLSDRYTFYDEKFQDAGVKQDFRDRIFGRYAEEFKEGPPDMEQLRVIQEIDDRILAKNVEMKADIEKHRDAGVEAFKATFTDEESVAQAEKYQELSKKLIENPDPTTFRLIEEMQESVFQDPKKREFIEAMMQDARASFIARAQAEGDVFYDKIATNNPRDLQFVADLQNEWRNDPDEFIPSPLMGFSPEGGLPQGFGMFGPPGAGQGFGPPPEVMEKIFAKFAERQSEVVAGNIDFINDPAIFAQFQGKFEGAPPDIVNEIQKHQANFSEMFQGKRDFILQKAIVQEEYEAQASFGGEKAELQASFEEKLNAAQSDEERSAISAEFDHAKNKIEERAGGFRGKFSHEILGAPSFLCDESCQKAQSEKFGDFRSNIQNQFEGFGGGAPPEGFQIPGLPPEVLEQIKAKFEGKFPGGFPGSGVPQGVPQGMPFQGQMPSRQQKPSEPKQLLDESGAPVRDDQREEFFQRQEEKKLEKARGEDFIPDTIFYRDDDARNPQLQKPPIEKPDLPPLPPEGFPKPSGDQFQQFIREGVQGQPPPQIFEGFKPDFRSFPQPSDFPQPSFNAPSFEAPTAQFPSGGFQPPQ